MSPRDFVRALKRERGMKCEHPDCKWEGEFTYEMLDFAHRDKSEKSPWYSENRGGASGTCSFLSFVAAHNNPREVAKGTVRKEAAKCDILCKNCHAIETAKNNDSRPPSIKPIKKPAVPEHRQVDIYDLIPPTQSNP